MYKIKVQLGASFEPLIPSFTTRVSPSGLLISAPPNCLPRGHREVRQEAVKFWGLVYRGFWRGCVVSRSQQDAGRMWINPLIQRTLSGCI